VCGIALTWGFPISGVWLFCAEAAQKRKGKMKERCHGDSLNAQSTRRTAA
jgi:hypothetical protein